MTRIIEGLCYLHPHESMLVATHPVMRGVWRKCISCLKQQAGTILAPLLIDDRVFEETLCEQSVEDLLWATTGRTYASLSWLGPPVSEAELERRHGQVGCGMLDATYHLEVTQTLALVDPEWEWIVVHPVHFQEQQAAMLEYLWQLVAEKLDIAMLAARQQKKPQAVRAAMRQQLFSHFQHHWVAEDGRVISHTRPIYASKSVVHQPL